MDTSLDRIRAKIAELEARLDSLKIAERELLQLEAPSTRTVSTPKPATRKTSVPRAAKAQAVVPAAEETGRKMQLRSRRSAPPSPMF